MTTPKTPKFKQITVAQWDGNNGLTYNLIGLAEDGTVWRLQAAGWRRVEKPMAVSQAQSAGNRYADEEPF